MTFLMFWHVQAAQVMYEAFRAMRTAPGFDRGWELSKWEASLAKQVEVGVCTLLSGCSIPAIILQTSTLELMSSHQLLLHIVQTLIMGGQDPSSTGSSR